MYPEEPPPNPNLQWGKGAWARQQVEHALERGEHVHSAAVGNGEHCMGGDWECPLYQRQLDEALEAWE